MDSNGKLIALGAVVTGLLIGYQKQVMADSGEEHLDKIAKSVVIAILSYLIATLMCIYAKHGYKRLNFIWAAILGSIFCSLFLNVVKFLLDNRKFSQSESMFVYLLNNIGDSTIRFLIALPIYCILSLMIFSTIHFTHKWLSRKIG
jgi:hypothetical protein